MDTNDRDLDDIDIFVIGNEYTTSVLKQNDFPLRKSARLENIETRWKLKTSDGQTLDDYDQFYRDHKLLLVLFRVLGVMPIQRADIGKISFRWFSSATIYAFFFYIITSILVVLVGRERLNILWETGKRFDEYIYSVIFVVFLVPHFWIPFVGWGVANEVADYKNTWTRFQLKYYKVTGRLLEFPHLQTLIIVISVGCLAFAVAFLMALSALLAGFKLWHTMAYYHIITMINMNCALWYINCRGVAEASDALSKSFADDVNEKCSTYIIKYYRHLWLMLSEIVQKLGNAYARTYSTYCLFLFVNITIAVYGFLAEIVDHGFRFSFKEMGLMVDTFYCSCLLFIFCDCAHQSTVKVAKRVADTLLSVNLKKVEQTTIKEIELFLVAIEMNPPVVSLKGYADVNRALLTSGIQKIAIYLIVLLQFKMSLSKDAEIT